MNKKNLLTVGVALGTFAVMAESPVSSALDKEITKGPAAHKWMVGAAADYFDYTAEFGGIRPGTYDDAFDGELEGDMIGGSLFGSLGNNAFLELGYRQGDLTGTLTSGVVPAQADIDRSEFELRLSLRKGDGLFGVKRLGGQYGVNWTWITSQNQLTLSDTYYWNDTGNQRLSYDEDIHVLMIDVGLQYDINLYTADSFQVSLVPRGLAGGGMAMGFTDDPADEEESEMSTGWAWKAQGTVSLEFRFGTDYAWRVFAEGGYKYFGIENMSGIYGDVDVEASRNFKGPYARAGVTYSF
jgi:hypothetical protein